MSPRIRVSLEIVLGGVVLAGALVWLSGGCGERIAPGTAESGAQAPAAAPPSTAVVSEETLEVFEQASGTLASERHTTVSSKILARIEQILVHAGSEVGREEVVIRLDSRDLEARVRAAEEEVSSARAALTLARAERDRYVQAHAAGAASRQQQEQAVAEFRVRTAELERARQHLEDAQVSRSYTEIRAPVAGRVIDRLAEPGDTAAPGTPLLRIYDPGALRLEVPVRESLATRLEPGQELTVHIEAAGESLVGPIDEIVPYAEPGARTFMIKVRLPARPGLYAGMFGRVEVPAGRRARVLVPEGAVERIGQLQYVLVVDDAGGSPARRLVTVGPPAAKGRLEVLSGLRAGERVLLPAADDAP